MTQFSIQTESIVLCEGEDDRRFLEGVFRKLKKGNIDAVAVGGKSKLLSTIQGFRAIKGQEKVKKLLILRDCDNDPMEEIISEINDVLDVAGLEKITKPGVFTTGKPQVALYVLPDNQNRGCLDTLCMNAIRKARNTTCLDEYLECIQNEVDEEMSDKSALAIWVVTHLNMKDYTKAVTANHIPLKSKLFTPLLDIIKSM